MKRFENRTALITGAARGIGAAIAKAFIREGAFVFITDIDAARGNELAKTLGENCMFLVLDVRREEDWAAAMKTVRSVKKELHVIVNNAAVTGYHDALGPQNPEETSLESWMAVHHTNLHGTFLGCKFGIAEMKNNTTHSSIINISSRSGLVGIPHAAAYASSKAAVRNHTKSVALYCAEMNYPINCNSIHPAAIRTEMWESMLNKNEDMEEQFRKLAKDIPLKRFGLPEEVAYATLFLAAEEAKYLTGIELNIDGGILAGSSASPSKQ